MKQPYFSLLPRWATRPLAALGLLATAGAAQAQTLAFAPASAYSSGGAQPYGLATGDVNGDGRPDLVTLNNTGYTVAVLLGSATAPGTFSAPTTYASGGTTGNAVSVTLGDVNGDGRPDVVATNSGNNTVGVLLNSATSPGSFGPVVTYRTGGSTGPRTVALGDVNGDGRLDIATASFNAGSLSILLNSATAPGTFGTPAIYSTGGSGTSGIALGDLDGDGRPDAVTLDYSTNKVAVFLNQVAAPGTFGAPATYSNGVSSSNSFGLTLGDLNGDTRLDVVTANSLSSTVSVLLNSATTPGTLLTATTYGSGGTYPLEVALNDLNGDGRADIAVSNYGSDNVGVLLNSAATPGTFAAASTFSTGAGTAPRALVLADLNADGRRDIATANYSAGTVGVLLSTTAFAPTLATISPTSGTVGTSVTLTGSNLSGATGVSFNGTAATTFAVVNSTTLTATVPTGATSGPVTVTTPGGTSNGVAFTVNTTAPTLTSPAANSTTNGLPTLAGTAPAGSTVILYLAMGSGAAQAIGTTTAPGSSFSFVPATTLASGSYSVYATAQSSGASVSAASSPVAFTADATPPTPTVSTTAGSPTSTAPIPFTVTFSEPITGFSASSVTVSNGTITSAITTAGNAYRFSVTPTADGVVSVRLAANVVQDAVGNGNVASNSLSATYATPVTATTWTGTVSTDWFTAGNWTQGVPDLTIDATIPTAPSGGRFPAVAAGTASARNLTFSSGATLSQSGGTIALAANLTNNGTFLPTDGTVSLGSTTLSSVLGSGNSRFWNLAVGTNGAQLSTPSGAAVQRLLTLNGTFATNGNAFVLESNNTLTALVVNNGSSVVNGTVTVRRAIDPSVNPGLGYRHYSAPVANSTVADVVTSGFAPVLNPGYNAAAVPTAVTPFPTVFGYDDSRLGLSNNLTSFDKGYFSPSAPSDALAVGRGYTVNLAATELVDFQGTLNNGDVSLALPSTRNTYPDGGWQLLGNPYPAPLDYSRVAAADRVNLDPAIYVYSSTSQYAGRYRAYLNGIGNPVVPVGQGFFARVALGQVSATMTFHNSQRLTAPNPTPLPRPADPRPVVQLELQGAGLADTFYAYAEAGATPTLDSQYDALKLPNPNGLNLAGTAASGESLAIDGRPAFVATTVLPLTVGVPAAGTYSLAAADLTNLPAGLAAYLADAATGQALLLAPGTSYSFSVSAAQATALLSGRFSLLFRPAALATTVTLTADVVSVYPSPTHERFTVTLPGLTQATTVRADLLNALGQVVRRQSAALPTSGTQLTLETANLATGIYTIRLQAGSSTLAKRVVVN